MTMETVMLLSATTALQGWFAARGRADAKGTDAFGDDEGLYHKSEQNGEVVAMAGRVLSTLPYFAVPRLVEIFAKAVSNPLFLSGGLLALNIIPTVLYLAYQDKTDLAAIFKTASAIMSLATQVLNLFMIGIVIANSAAPIGAAALASGTLFGALSLASIVHTTYMITKE